MRRQNPRRLTTATTLRERYSGAVRLRYGRNRKQGAMAREEPAPGKMSKAVAGGRRAHLKWMTTQEGTGRYRVVEGQREAMRV